MRTALGLLLPFLVALPAAGRADAQQVGGRLPELALEDFTGTPAASLDDLQGQAVLIEFFAFW